MIMDTPEYKKLVELEEEKIKMIDITKQEAPEKIGYGTALREAIADMSEAIFVLGDKLLPFMVPSAGKLYIWTPKELPEDYSAHRALIFELTDTVTNMTLYIQSLERRVEQP